VTLVTIIENISSGAATYWILPHEQRGAAVLQKRKSRCPFSPRCAIFTLLDDIQYLHLATTTSFQILYNCSSVILTLGAV
jgi:hypothetical protein